MSSLEKRAWLMLCSMIPPYLVYFVIQFAFPSLVSDLPTHLICLAFAAGIHALLYLSGWLVLKRQEFGNELIEDERDQAIDARATRAGYFLLIIGMIVVGVLMPFSSSGWKIINSALLFIILAESLRYVLIALSYRSTRRAN